jgi:ATP-dependent DNA ligase
MTTPSEWVFLTLQPSPVLYLDHIEDQGVELFRLCCEQDLEGIVAKPKQSPYRSDGAPLWIKIKNPAYSQAEGRHELFDSRRRR